MRNRRPVRERESIEHVRSHARDGFQQYLQRRGFAKRSIESYLEILRYMARWQPELDPVNLTGTEAKEFTVWLCGCYRKADGNALASSTRVRLIAALRQFGAWLRESGLAAFDPCESIPAPRASPRKERPSPDAQEVRKLLWTPWRSPDELRDTASTQASAC